MSDYKDCTETFVQHLLQGVSLEKLVSAFELSDKVLDNKRAEGDAGQFVIDVRGWIISELEKRSPKSCAKWLLEGDGASDIRLYFAV